jgi:hypothetical protein
MATLTLPTPSVPMVDKDGNVTPEWRRYFTELTRLVNAGL